MKDLSKKLDLGVKTAEIVNNTHKLLTTSMVCLAQADDTEKAIDFIVDVLQEIKLGVRIDKDLDNEEIPLEETEIKVSKLEKGYEKLRKAALETIGKMI